MEISSHFEITKSVKSILAKALLLNDQVTTVTATKSLPIVSNKGLFSPCKLIEEIVAAGKLSFTQLASFTGIEQSRLKTLAQGRPYRMLDCKEYNKLVAAFFLHS